MGLGRLPWFERATLGASGVTLGVALASWALMRIGAYSLGRALGLTALVVVGALVLARRSAATELEPDRAHESPRVVLVALALCLAFGVLYALYPTYFLLGGQDPGPYLAFSARVAKTGGLQLGVPAIQHWAATHAHGLFRGFPAVYGNLAEPAPDALEAQFLHLFTAFCANFYALGGVEGAVRVNAWPAVLCLATAFALLSRLAGRGAALWFLLALAVNPAFVWASRITLTEMLALWLNLSGLWLLVIAWDLVSLPAGVLAGAAFALGILNRLDGGLGSFALLGFAVAALVGEPAHRRVALAAALAHLAASGFAYRDAYLLSPVYCHSLAQGSSTATLLPVVTSGLDLVAMALALLPVKVPRALGLNETRLRFAGYLAASGGVLWLGYGLFVRPVVDPSQEGQSLRELTWYVGWAAWPLMLGGIVLALGAQAFRRSLPLVLFTLGTLFIYTVRTDVAPVHIWASRRWVPHVIPLVLACSSFGTAWLVAQVRSGWRKLGTGAVAAVALLAAPLDFDRPFLFQSMLDGLPQAYERVAAFARQHPAKWPLLTRHVHYGSILTYVYEVPTLVLNDDGAVAFARGDFAGGLAVGFSPFDLRHPAEDPRGYFGQYLDSTKGHRPEERVDVRYELGVGEIGPNVFDVEMPAAHSSFRTQVGQRWKDGSVVTTGARGGLHYGPWCDLTPGRYRIEWYGRYEAGRSKPAGTFDVISRGGDESHAETPLLLVHGSGNEVLLAGLDFTLTKPVEGVEFRTRIADQRAQLGLTRLRLQRFGEP